MHTLDQGYHQAASTQPSFAPPPTMGGAPAGGGGGIEGMWNPSGGGGGGVAPPPRTPINPPIAKPPITGPIDGDTVLPGSTPDTKAATH
ncbi:hypothetical protein HUW46_05098 [Amycolatopsis sp. CA-230715]|nr:hypothetical protein HUW46_05098 [Amycolatopsis sp. CA-230715]